MNPIEIPTLLFWENGNSWYGSLGSLRFFIKPEASDGGEEKQLSVQIWKGGAGSGTELKSSHPDGWELSLMPVPAPWQWPFSAAPG